MPSLLETIFLVGQIVSINNAKVWFIAIVESRKNKSQKINHSGRLCDTILVGYGNLSSGMGDHRPREVTYLPLETSQKKPGHGASCLPYSMRICLPLRPPDVFAA